MKILDFFKKRKEKIEIEEEVINFKDLDSWIEDKSLEFKNKKTEFHTLLKGCVSKLSQDIKQNTPSLKNIDWEKMKVEERIKHTVKENLINYESHLNDLIRELNNLEESKLNKEEILNKEIQMLASIIDFKALARVWHENPKEMSPLTE